MSTPQSFRSAFNGFNREDVVHYIEFINLKHTTEVNQLKSDLDALQTKLNAADTAPDLTDELEALRQERSSLLEKVAELETQLAAAQETKAAPQCQVGYELETYRRAERTEREARERAEQVYHQANSALADATIKVEAAANEIGQMSDAVLAQLNLLQAAVTGSKNALKDAAATMYTIRPSATEE